MIIEQLYTIDRSKGFITQTHSILDEIYLHIKLDASQNFKDEYYLEDCNLRRFLNVIVENRNDALANPTYNMQRKDVFYVNENEVLIRYRTKRGTYFEPYCSFTMRDNADLKATYNTTFRMLLAEQKEEFEPYDYGSYIFMYLITVEQTKPYIIIQPTIPPFKIIRFYSANAFRIYKRSVYLDFHGKYKLFSHDDLRYIGTKYDEKIFEAYDYIETFQEFPALGVSSNKLQLIPEYQTDREMIIDVNDFLIVYGGLFSDFYAQAPYVFLIFEIVPL